LQRLTNLFPLWVLLGSALALIYPAAFTWFAGDLIVWGLAVIMLGMGITLGVDDFRGALRTPKPILLGVVAQFTIMPLLGWSIAHGLALDTPLAVGLILVACCPGGTASNVVTHIANANLALSVLMTTGSTMAAIAFTPLLTGLLAGTYVDVDEWALFRSTVQVVLLPVVIGVFLNQRVPALVRIVLPVAPVVAVAAIVLICASIIGRNGPDLLASGPSLMLAVTLLHGGGFGLGYLLARLCGYDERTRRTTSIEVGMQNSGLGAVLATRHFADPITALPSAISATMHSLIGSLLAARWRRDAR
jgi:BASS family bile acid:Na+ symporter